MQLDGMLGDDKLLGDLLIGKACADEPENLALALGKGFEDFCPLFSIYVAASLCIRFVAGKIECKRVCAINNYFLVRQS